MTAATVNTRSRARRVTRTCTVPGCKGRFRTTGMLVVCSAHWYRVPWRIRQLIVRSWNRGRPTLAYPLACDAAVRSVSTRRGNNHIKEELF